jgi:exodeoxyribonuclease V alpha subunit
VREGLCGVAALNGLVEDLFQEQQLLIKESKWYMGRPILIGRNDYNLHLFNGDVGIFLPDLLTGTAPRVFFPGTEGGFRAFHPLRLPEHETVFATTVHKSQGSEFDQVMFVLPDRDSPVLTRELVYTAITRARQRVSLWGPEKLFLTAVSRSTRRMSGLAEELWGNPGRE